MTRTPSRRAGTVVMAAVLAATAGATMRAQSGAATSAFVGKMWVATDADAAPGSLRVFTADGTLLMTSCTETYRTARWTRVSARRIRWQEDTASIEADVSGGARELTLTLHLRGGTKVEHYRLASAPFVCGDLRPTPEPNAWVVVAPSGPAPTLTGRRGTVRHLEIEGGVWVIRDEAGTQFSPSNLPEAFRADGLAVEFDARRRDDMVSTGMTGPLIEIVRIRRRPAP